MPGETIQFIGWIFTKSCTADIFGSFFRSG